MTLRRGATLLLIGLGALAGAVLPTDVRAQVPVRRDTLTSKKDTARTRVDTAGGRANTPPAGRDTIKVPLPARADSMLRNDSLNRSIVPIPVVKIDTLKPAITRAEAPPILEITQPRIYDRSRIFATGAVTLSDMLSRVPGLTEYTTGFLAAPALIASSGNFRRIRIYLDGIELDPMDRRSRGVSPINDLPLHALEEVRIERGADEVRVYARTWRVDRTDPFTRADVFTGDQNTNLFRAYLGRRYAHGELLQLSADYANTQPDRRLPSSDAVNAMARLGLTRGPWSLDGFFERTGRNRAQWIGTGQVTDQRDTVPGLATRRITSYLRLGNGDPDGGRWFQLVASANDYHGQLRTSNAFSATTTTFSSDSLAKISDSSSYTSQYVIAGGTNRGPFHIGATERVRVGGNRVSHVLSGRASATSTLATASLFGEGRSYLDPARAEASVRIAPLSRIVVVGTAAKTGAGTFDRLLSEPRAGTVFTSAGTFITTPGPVNVLASDTAEVTRYSLEAATSFRGEVGVQLRDLWLSGGVLRRGPTTLLPPAEFAGRYTSAKAVKTEGEASARTIAARGRLWRAINVDAWGLAWNDTLGYYRPRYQTHTELYIQTNLLDKFPKGNFGLLSSLTHEYRSSSRFPVAGDTVRIAPGYRAIAFKLEIRIQTAVVSYQFRNLLQEKYAEVPGFRLPTQTQFYGVRWDFWN